MSYRRAARLSLLVAFAFSSACGDPSTDAAPTRDDSGAIRMTVVVPNFYQEDYTVEVQIYSVASEESFPPQQATVESRGRAVAYGEYASADVWSAALDLEPGEYVATFHCFADDELLCVASHKLTVTADTTEHYLVLTFFPECNRIDFPDPAAGSKSVCFSDTGFLLSAEIPATAESVASMRYFLSPSTTDDLGEPLHGGALGHSGNGLADLGQGPILTEIWEATFGVLVWYTGPYALELTAVDDQGEPICQLSATVDLQYGELNRFHYVLPCEP